MIIDTLTIAAIAAIVAFGTTFAIMCFCPKCPFCK